MQVMQTTTERTVKSSGIAIELVVKVDSVSLAEWTPSKLKRSTVALHARIDAALLSSSRRCHGKLAPSCQI